MTEDEPLVMPEQMIELMQLNLHSVIVCSGFIYFQKGGLNF